MPVRPFPLAAALLLAAGPALAQQRPLRTQDPVPVPAGRVRVEAGVQWEPDRRFPLSGLTGDLLGLPRVGFTIGFGRIDLQIHGGFQLLWIDARDPSAPFADKVDVPGHRTHDIVDPVLATRVLLQHETRRRPAVGVRIATKLPSASNKQGIGTDATDLYVSLLAGKDVGPARVAANFGMGILSIPETGDRQNDVLAYGLSVAAPVGRGWTVVAEANGRKDVKTDTPPGTEDLGQARLGVTRRVGPVTLDAALTAGLESPESDLGFTAGATWEVRGFEPGD